MAMMENTAQESGKVAVNGVELYYESYGDINHPAVLLVCGMGVQLTYWPQSLVQSLVEQGFRVVRFDNRDVGLSGDTPIASLPWFPGFYLRHVLRGSPSAPYNLHQLVDDAVGLLDALSIEQAHWIGFSMGGMISQLAAIHYPQKVVSLAAIMSSTNERHLPGPSLTLKLALIKGAPKTLDEAKERTSVFRQLLEGSVKEPMSYHQQFASEAVDRAYRPKAGLLHKLAVLATPGFARQLRQLTLPVLVIHGDGDDLLPLACGEHIAANAPDARLQVLPGMGHNFPPSMLTTMTEQLLDNLRRVA